MQRAELERNLAVTSKHLVAARALLRDDLPPAPDGATLQGFEECLRQNEMEFALDELEDLGLACHPVAEFWKHLMHAAENMQLTDRAAEFKVRMQRT
jgi:L-serine deaminase